MMEPFVINNSDVTGNGDHDPIEDAAIFNVYNNDGNNNNDSKENLPIGDMDLLDGEYDTWVIDYQPTHEEEELLFNLEQMDKIHHV